MTSLPRDEGTTKTKLSLCLYSVEMRPLYVSCASEWVIVFYVDSGADWASLLLEMGSCFYFIDLRVPTSHLSQRGTRSSSVNPKLESFSISFELTRSGIRPIHIII